MATNTLGLGIDDRGFFNVITFTVSVPFCFAYKWQIVLDLLLLLLHPFNGLFSRTIWVIQYQKDKISLMRQEMMGFRDGSGSSWTICKQSAPRSRQKILTNTSSLSFYRPHVVPDTKPLKVFYIYCSVIYRDLVFTV